MLFSLVDMTTCLCDEVDMNRDLRISKWPCPMVM